VSIAILNGTKQNGLVQLDSKTPFVIYLIGDFHVLLSHLSLAAPVRPLMIDRSAT